jgi:hypothetical protein
MCAEMTPMLDIEGAIVLDKSRLIGGCSRLKLVVDSERLQREVALLPDTVWGSTAGRVGVHQSAEALFLRGFAPAEGDKPVEDRPPLDRLPYARSIIEQLIPAPRLRCLLARLPAGATINRHVDLPPYFSKSLRLHVPIETNPQVYMVVSGLSYRMQPGEVWALNNSAPHAVWNAHPSASRTHMICDFLPSAALLAMLNDGERHLGERRADVESHLSWQPGLRATAGG